MPYNVCVSPIVVIPLIWCDNNNSIYFSFIIILSPLNIVKLFDAIISVKILNFKLLQIGLTVVSTLRYCVNTPNLVVYTQYCVDFTFRFINFVLIIYIKILLFPANHFCIFISFLSMKYFNFQ